MTLTQEQCKELILYLDHYHALAQRLQREMKMTLSAQDEAQFVYVRMRALNLVNALEDASDALKRANEELIRSYVTGWHHFRLDDDSEKEEPMYESVRYDGGDVWVVIVTTSTHGRERVVVHSDAASWYTVYSADPL